MDNFAAPSEVPAAEIGEYQVTYSLRCNHCDALLETVEVESFVETGIGLCAGCLTDSVL